MKILRVLTILTAIALLASNAFLVFQVDRMQVKENKLQANVVSLKSSLNKTNSYVSAARSDISDFCDNFNTFNCP